MTTFENQCVIVTGAAAGIGLGIAQAFWAEGANVVVSDFREDALAEAEEAFPSGERLAFVQTDVRDEDAVAQLLEAAEARFGPIAVMVANAGIVPNSSVLNMTRTDWDAVIDTNLTGVFLTCQAAARSMVRNGTEGRIVTISSIARNVGRLGASGYCASKAGVEMFTKVLAMELAERKINVNSVAPGIIAIPGRPARGNSEFGEAIERAIPAGHRGQVGDVAEAVLFLCSPAARYITGAVLPVDGGASTGWTHMPYSSPQS